ncbi:MAG: response regulator [Gammaproteobacteria bacterium]|nr:response regulator [Gammaproteobacteria bacterium]
MSEKRILLVDDEPTVLRVLRLQLQRAGYEVDTAPNGEVALEKIRSAAPDVLITDIEMPRMTGEELCQAIQREFPERRFPIFVATSLTGMRHREWTRDFVLLDFLEKPLSARKLLATLAEYFDSIASEATL